MYIQRPSGPRGRTTQISLLIRIGGLWPPSAFLEDSHDQSRQRTGPDLIVLGLDEERKPRAARFPASQTDLVAKAAQAMNFTVCKPDGAALTELVKKLPIWPVVRDWPWLRATSGAKPVRQDRRAIATRRSAGAGGRRSVGSWAASLGVARYLGRHCRGPHGDRP